MASPDQNPELASTRPIAVLRAMIDSVDHDVLQLLSRRNGLIAEVAQYKRENSVAIRDLERERTIIRDRRNRGGSLGLSPELIESMYRLILWGSRDRQAALKAEVPADVEPRTIAVIGGSGEMGFCMAEMFGDLGHAVMIADVNTQLTPHEAARLADVVIISVPIDRTVEVIHELGPHVRPEALLMDVTSIKSAPVEAMLAATRASVVGTHPLFAPSVHSLQGQRVVLTRGRGDEWFDWVKRMFRARGLNDVETTPEKHDRAMSVVQVLTHFATEVMGLTFANMGITLEETLQFTSPIYLIELLMTARHFAQSPELYSSIQMSNTATNEVTAAFLEAAKQLAQVAADKDSEAFKAIFNEVRGFFGPFTDHALEQSTFLIDRLAEQAIG